MRKISKQITRKDHTTGGMVHDHQHSMGGMVHDHNHSMGGMVHDHNHSTGGMVHDHNHSMGGMVHDHNHSIGGVVHDHANTIEAELKDDGYAMILSEKKGGLYSKPNGRHQWGYLKIIDNNENKPAGKSASKKDQDGFNLEYINDTILFVNNKNIKTLKGEINREIYFKVKSVPVTLMENVQIDIAIAYDLDFVNSHPERPKPHEWVDGKWQ